MPEENQNSENGQTADGEKVELDAKTYNALIDRLDELEDAAKVADGSEAKGDDIDDLLQEGQQQVGAQEQILDLDRMGNSELAGYIAEELTSNALNPIVVKVAQLELTLEGMRLSGQKGYEDYSKQEKKILPYLHQHPTLSLKEAYNQVVGKPKIDEGESESDKDKEKTDLKSILKRTAIHGEKPSNIGSSQIEKTGPVDTRSAAAKAIKELNVNF